MDDCARGTTKLYIGGLDEKATSKDIGFAFVDFSDFQDASDAVARLDGTKIAGTRVRVEISNQGRNPSTFAATFKKKKGPVRSGFTFFGNKNNAPRQNPGKTGFKKKFDRVKGRKVSPKNNSSRENSPHEDYSRKRLLRSKSREYSIPKRYSSRDNKRETCHEERFEFKREIKTEEKWSYSSYKEERPALRERSRVSMDRRNRKRYHSPERYRDDERYSEDRNYPEDRYHENSRGYPEYYDRYPEHGYPKFPTRCRDRSQRRSRSRSHSPRREFYSPRPTSDSPRRHSYSPRVYHHPPRYSPGEYDHPPRYSPERHYQPRPYHDSSAYHYTPSYPHPSPPPSKRSRY